MARDAEMEARLLRWAQWVKVGDGSGYASVSVLHVDWTPPSPGQRPGLKVAASSDAPQTHRALRQLSQRLQDTVVLHYVIRVPLAEQAARLGCAPDTVLGRVERAHAELRRVLGEPEFCKYQSTG